MSHNDYAVTYGQESLLSLPESSIQMCVSNGQTSMASTTFNLINAIIGAGVLALPWAFSKIGMGLGILLLVIFAVMTALSCLLINWCCENTGCQTYGDVAEAAFGTAGKMMVEINKIFFSFGACTGYLIIIANELEILTVLITNGHEAFYTNRVFLLVAVVLVFILPLSLLKSLEKLSFTSFLAILCVAFTTIAILIRVPYHAPCKLAANAFYDCGGTHKNPDCTMQYRHSEAQFHNYTDCLMQCERKLSSEAVDLGISGGKVDFFLFSLALFKALPLFVFAFNCQIQFVSYKYSMYNPTPKRVKAVLGITLSFCLFVYMINALGGYMTFCDETLPNVLDSYVSSDRLVLPARAALSFTLMCSYPLYSHAIRDSVELTFFKYEPNSLRQRICHVVITFTTVGLMTIIAASPTNLDQVLGVTGAIAGSALVYIIPGGVYAKLLTIHNKHFSLNAIAGILFSFFGIAIAIFCSIVVLLT